VAALNYKSSAERKEYRLDTDLLPNDDDLHEEAKIAMHAIAIILQDFPPCWQRAILKSLGIRMFILHEQQQENPPQRPTLSA
jgi:hypothetical protein